MSEARLFVIAAPSGAGKTSLVHALVSGSDDVVVAVSHTTRQIRPGETDGNNYFFVTRDEFRALIDDGGFLEWAEVFGNYYGTSRREAERLMASGKHLILEIDWQGAAQVKALMPDTSAIFILPPSLPTLRQRLEARAQDDPVTMKRRTDAAIEEISHIHEFDYVIVNDDFNDALADLGRIVAGDAEDLHRDRLSPSVSALISDLLANS